MKETAMLIDYFEIVPVSPRARRRAINRAMLEHIGSAESAMFAYTKDGDESTDEEHDALLVVIENSDHAPSHARRASSFDFTPRRP